MKKESEILKPPAVCITKKDRVKMNLFFGGVLAAWATLVLLVILGV